MGAVLVVALLLGVLVGFLIPHPFRWQWAASIPAASVGPTEPFVPSDWEYPNAKSLTKIEGGSTDVKRSGISGAVTFVPNLYAFSTPDELEKVWAHYAKLSGIDDTEFKPGVTNSKTDFSFSVSARGGHSTTGGVMYYTGDRDRKSIRSATIVTQRPDYTVTVFISRGKDEEQTHINIVVEKKSQPAP
jgi:hypothetical protein